MRPRYLAPLAAFLLACGTTGDPLDHAVAHEERLPYDSLVAALAGAWVDQPASGEHVFQERWWPGEGDVLLEGLGCVMADQDTVWIEHLAVVHDGGELHYEARIPSQNEGRPIRFRLTEYGPDSLVFTNPSHDHPQRIAYIRWGDGWIVRVSGVDDGEPRGETYRFRPQEPAGG